MIFDRINDITVCCLHLSTSVHYCEQIAKKRQQPNRCRLSSFYHSRNRDSTASDTITSSTITVINTHLVGVMAIPPLCVYRSHNAADRFAVRHHHPLRHSDGHQTVGINVHGNMITAFHSCTSLAVQYPPCGNSGGDCGPSFSRCGTTAQGQDPAHPSG